MSIKYPYQLSLAKYPAVRLAILFAGGIIVSHFIGLSIPALLVANATFIILYLSAQSIFRNKLTLHWHYTSLVIYLFIVFLLGCLRNTEQAKNTNPGRLIEALQPDTLAFSGRILSVRHYYSYDECFFAVDSVQEKTNRTVSLPFHVLLKIKKSQSHPVSMGDYLHLSAEIIPIPPRRNPDVFDYGHWLASKRVFAEANVIKVYSNHPIRNRLSWLWWRKKIEYIIERNFSPDNIPIAKALLLGQKQEVQSSDKQAFIQAGLAHLMAVSGLHVGFIVAPFWLIIPLLWTHRFGKPAGLLLLLIVLFSYAGLTGFTASVVRASLTAFLLSIGRLYQKVREPINLTAVSALCILIFDPSALFSVGFQLSFSAVFTILLVLPVAERILPERHKHRWYSFIPQTIIISTVVQIGLFPLLIYYFHQLSLVAPLANIVAVPMAQFIVIWSFAGIFIGAVFPTFGTFFSIPADRMIGALDKFANIAGSFQWSSIYAHVSSPLIFIVWIAFIIFISTLFIPRLRWKGLGLLIVMLTIYQANQMVHHFGRPKLILTVFDVGQGDAILLQTPNGKNVMIDTGIWHPHSNSAKEIILPELRAKGIRRLNAVLLTHPHADHIGGVNSLINAIPIDTIYNSGHPYQSALYRRYNQEALAKHIPVKHLHTGMMLNVDPSIAVFVMSPDKNVVSANANTPSVVLKIVYGKTSFLLTGDVEKESELQMDATFGSFLKTTFLKVAHHGGATSTNPVFLHYAHPKIAAVSVGLHNRYHHPSLTVVHRLLASGAQVHYTSLERGLVFVSDGYHVHEIHWY